jgi:hypothetical protein
MKTEKMIDMVFTVTRLYHEIICLPQCHQSSMVFILITDFAEISDSNIPIPENYTALQSLLQIGEVEVKQSGVLTSYKFRCKAPNYYFSTGFIWQIVRYNGLQEFLSGTGWVKTHINFHQLKDASL